MEENTVSSLPLDTICLYIMPGIATYKLETEEKIQSFKKDKPAWPMNQTVMV